MFATKNLNRNIMNSQTTTQQKPRPVYFTAKQIATLLNRDANDIFFAIREFVENSYVQELIDKEFFIENFFNVENDTFNIAFTFEGFVLISRLFEVSEITKIVNEISSFRHVSPPAPENAPRRESILFDDEGDESCLIATMLKVAKNCVEKEDKIIHDALKTLRFDPEKREETCQRFKRMILEGKTKKVLEESQSMIETATTSRKSTLF